jgi:hypothetical protein
MLQTQTSPAKDAAADDVLTLRARKPAALSCGLYGSGRLMAEDVDVALLGNWLYTSIC